MTLQARWISQLTGLALLALWALGGAGPTPVLGQTVITGDGLPASGFSSLSRETDRVLQQFFDASFFASITEPATITSMSFRLPAAADVDYPAFGDLDFGRYEITLARPSAAAAAAAGLTSATFSENMVEPVLVRSGPVTFPQGSFVANGAGEDAEFSFSFVFDTPYDFTPGQDLVLLVRHDGHGNLAETLWNFDGYAWPGGTALATGDVDAAVAGFPPGDFDVANRLRFSYEIDPAAAAVEIPTLSPAGLVATILLIGIAARRALRACHPGSTA